MGDVGGWDPPTDRPSTSTPSPGSPPAPAPQPEQCNGFDDDGDGQVDETCACAPGATQQCFPGAQSQLTGLCSGGTQRCDGSGEFGSWGPCTGAVAPGKHKEICEDGIDQDCDGVDNSCCKPSPEICDGKDNDCDGKVDEGMDADGDGYSRCKGDCDDNNPFVHPGAQEKDNGVDDDCDGKVDEGFNKPGDVWIKVAWNTKADIDLHVTEPNGFTTYFNDPASPTKGVLDVDDGAFCPGSGGPENIYWPVGKAPTGVYKVKLVYYKPCAGSGPTQYNVSVTVDGKVSTFSGTIKPHQDPTNPIQITTFKR